MLENASKVEIDNTYDFSNYLPTPEGIMFLVEYCYSVYTGFTKLLDDDEKKNKMLMEQDRVYEYKRNYNDLFEVHVRPKMNEDLGVGYNDIWDFRSAMQAGKLYNVGALRISMNLNFLRNSNGYMEDHNNSFLITFLPYNIKVNRRGNYHDKNMEQIEQGIINTMKLKFPKGNSIFCYKKDE